VIDLHSHVLPSVDDGVDSLAEARAIVRAAGAEGVTAIAATPHVRDDYPTTPEQMERGVGELQADFAAAGIGVEVLHGGEIALDRLAALSREDLQRFTLAQSGRYLLLECPYSGSPLVLAAAVKALDGAGLTPVIAHPERNAEVQRRPRLVAALVELGALVQITAASVDRRFGRASQAAAEQLLELGLAHVLASDAHGPEIGRGGLTGAREALDDEDLARYLLQEAPAAIVAGEVVPRPPRLRRRRRFRLF
jgi:protein-tyrosine phosphatase